jgi:hypothetical protein
MSIIRHHIHPGNVDHLRTLVIEHNVSCHYLSYQVGVHTFMLSNDTEFREYVKTYFLPKAPDSELAPLWSAHPDDLRDGSPSDTGIFWAFQRCKRIAAF